ncbi:hypothetical protein GCM10009721_43360 [Terrabacter tumescens]|uniref:Uncharacterized protein n=1 Tax=Terrabacter tumescens TaxID=60443 RepID=A0ABQ2IGL2_9MICO|nr:hypothetical protein GCM10009721_43360 [Terrabacter tumescens]
MSWSTRDLRPKAWNSRRCDRAQAGCRETKQRLGRVMTDRKGVGRNLRVDIDVPKGAIGGCPLQEVVELDSDAAFDSISGF